ncbi:hypothetical protein INR49_005335 [Caranx melampygus]|nr:hypothetical protein INR49_005335 [Caranx melampygus]
MVQQLSKSGAKEAPQLKAGHPPAGNIFNYFLSGSIVRAGGKRVAKKSLEESTTHGTPEKETKRSDKLSSKSLGTASRMQQVGILLSGTLDKLSHDFPETPVSVRHSKVRPAVEKPHSPGPSSSSSRGSIEEPAFTFFFFYFFFFFFFFF